MLPKVHGATVATELEDEGAFSESEAAANGVDDLGVPTGAGAPGGGGGDHGDDGDAGDDGDDGDGDDDDDEEGIS